VSRIVVDLVGESGFEFKARGRHELTAGEKGQPLFAVG
jgi:hypothetical protein